VAFSQELLAAYPDAKVILPIREVNSWHASVMKTVYWRVNDPELRIASFVDWGASLYYPMLRTFFDTFFEGDFPNRGKDIYIRHYNEIRSLVPKDRLLEYHIAQGWGPICEFLGVPKPFEDFPRSNDIDNFVRRCRSRNRRQMGNASFKYLVIELCIGMVLWIVMHTLKT
jgi:hypothetical protein